MTETATLQVTLRDKIGKADNKKLKKDGYLVGNINSKGNPSIAIAIKKDEFRRTIKTHGRNAVLKLKGENKHEYDVMVKAVQVDPKDYSYHHVEFQQVNLSENVKAEVALRFNGVELLESKRLILNRLVDLIPVSGLPQDIPHAIEFDVSKSVAGDNIFISDLKFAEGINPEVDEQLLIASIIDSKVKEVEEEGQEAEE